MVTATMTKKVFQKKQQWCIFLRTKKQQRRDINLTFQRVGSWPKAEASTVLLFFFFLLSYKKTTIDKYNNNSLISSNHIASQYHYSIIDHFSYMHLIDYIFERFVFQLFSHFEQQESTYLN